MILILRNVCANDSFNIRIYRFIQTKIFFTVCISLHPKPHTRMYAIDTAATLNGHQIAVAAYVRSIWHQLSWTIDIGLLMMQIWKIGSICFQQKCHINVVNMQWYWEYEPIFNDMSQIESCMMQSGSHCWHRAVCTRWRPRGGKTVEASIIHQRAGSASYHVLLGFRPDDDKITYM